MVGTPLYIDNATATCERMAYARCFVEISAKDTLPKAVKLDLGDGEWVETQVQYEWLPPRCTKCITFEHVESQCPMITVEKRIPKQRIFVAEGNSDEVDPIHKTSSGHVEISVNSKVGNTIQKFEPVITMHFANDPSKEAGTASDSGDDIIPENVEVLNDYPATGKCAHAGADTIPGKCPCAFGTDIIPGRGGGVPESSYAIPGNSAVNTTIIPGSSAIPESFVIPGRIGLSDSTSGIPGSSAANTTPIPRCSAANTIPSSAKPGNSVAKTGIAGNGVI